MDDYFTGGGITVGVIILSGVIYKIYNAINHKKCESDCNGAKTSISFDVSETPRVKENTIVYVRESRSSSLEPEPTIRTKTKD